MNKFDHDAFNSIFGEDDLEATQPNPHLRKHQWEPPQPLSMVEALELPYARPIGGFVFNVPPSRTSVTLCWVDHVGRVVKRETKTPAEWLCGDKLVNVPDYDDLSAVHFCVLGKANKFTVVQEDDGPQFILVNPQK